MNRIIIFKSAESPQVSATPGPRAMATDDSFDLRVKRSDSYSHIELVDYDR